MAATKMQLTDWLDDLSVRFIVNLPREELESVERICFQVEEAQWFYEDFVRPLDPHLPSLNLRQFSMKIFQHCPLFSSYGEDVHSKAFAEFLAYKTRVPVRGAIMLNETMDEVILVKGWKKGANWSFPRGKINKDEKDIDCAVREVYEETGYDIRAAGLVGDDDNAKFIEVTMREQHMKLFVFAGIPMDTYFEPRTRKEISKIQWYKLSELPTLKKIKQHHQNGVQATATNANKFYMVAPFLNPLKKIISSLRKSKVPARSGTNYVPSAMPEVLTSPNQFHEGGYDEPPATNDMTRLVGQLRQSQQASREANYPEVTGPVEATRAASLQLKNLLKLPPDTHAEPAHMDATTRESKANAMLSLLRGGTNAVSAPAPTNIGLPPQTPFEQIFGQPTQPPPSPKQNVRNARGPNALPNLPSPPGFPFSPEQVRDNAVMARPQYPFSSNQQNYPAQHFHQQLEYQRPQQTFRSQPPAPAPAPYQRTGDPQFAQAPRFPDHNSSVIPPANQLPPPKLNAHSSTLLSLFKSPPTESSVPASTSLLSAVEPSRQELSVASPTVPTRPQHPISVPSGYHQMMSSTSALATPASTAPRTDTPKRSSQQETLLNLFRQPKPSPSLEPAKVPVELSAQGSPTHSRVSSLANKSSKPAKPLVNGHVTIQKRAENPIKTSATVSGPLNVPQFEKILRRPAEANKTLEESAQINSNGSAKPQTPIKILSRPDTVANLNQDFGTVKSKSPKPSRSPRRDKKTVSKETAAPPFQPQILRRPETGMLSSGNTSPHAIPTSNPTSAPALSHLPSLLTRESPALDRRTSQSLEQKSALLALFGKTSIPPRASPVPRQSMVSPLSEKPPAGSEFPSPLGGGRSRLGSLQDGRAIGRDGIKVASSPVDKKFLLGFLDQTIKESRK